MASYYRPQLGQKFVTASNQYWESTGAYTTAPVTMACWFTLATGSIGTGQCLMALSKNGSLDDRMFMRVTGLGLFSVQVRQGSSATTAAAGTCVENKLHHGLVVIRSATNYQAYLDGIGGTVGTTSRVPSGINRSQVGAGANFTGNEPFGGDIFWPCFWDIELTEREIARLAAGEFPGYIGHPYQFLDWSEYPSGTVICNTPRVGQLAPGGRKFTPVNSPVPVMAPAFLKRPLPYSIPRLVGTGAAGTNTGTLNITLGAITLAAAGTGTQLGSLNSVLDAIAISAAGTGTQLGSLTKTLDAIAISSTGTVATDANVGTLTQTLGGITIASSGTGTQLGSLTNALDAIAITATGTGTQIGSLSQTLGTITLASSVTNGDAVVLAPSLGSVIGPATVGGVFGPASSGSVVSTA